MFGYSQFSTFVIDPFLSGMNRKSQIPRGPVYVGPGFKFPVKGSTLLLLIDYFGLYWTDSPGVWIHKDGDI